ncbi:MAG: DEAD/DEAH box helicase, partial [Coriobacteriaceae bacterium]|nr:DEAD/DEAH box helicase [Coriobacteriaceae bacterium]
YKRPTFIFTIEEGRARGSGRSYGNLNLFQAASTCTDLFESFGGHDAACGVTLPTEKLEEFTSRICRECAQAVPEVEEAPVADVEAHLDECDVEGFEELERLEPFGTGNAVPHLLARNVFLDDRKRVGKTDNHLRFKATDGVVSVPCIQFNAAHIEELVGCESACDIVFEPSIDEWKGHKNAQLRIDEIRPQETTDATETGNYVAELFEHEDEICDTGDYAGITQATSFNTKVVGVTFENRQDVIETLEAGEELQLVREPENEFDENAIAVRRRDGTQLGYLNRQLAERLAPVMDAGVAYDAAISAITGREEDGDLRKPGPLGVRDPGITERSLGVNIVVRKSEAYDEAEDLLAQHRKDLRETKKRWQALDPGALTEKIADELIGTHDLHPAQTEALEALDQGASVLTVMATGRGKSLIFHTHAARCALQHDQASIFVYPLRALVADQSFHLMEVYERFGLTVRVLTGETEEKDRTEIYDGIRTGDIDVILTTPEFLGIHAQEFAECGRIGFVVVDEAHHIGLSKAGTRPAYGDLGRALEELGGPQVLACTATAGDEVAKSIRETLSIERLVLDPSIRENLHIDDRRDLRDRANYLASLVAEGGKCVAYVNSRDQTIQLARMLRHRLPGLAPKIGFYNAGLPKEDRKRIETAFREGDLVCIISTSAFGEGIDIPDIEHVVLYHLPFNDIEFNQMSGRSGRDGRDATIHLLYSYGDARINENILASSAPTRDALAALYHVLSEKGKDAALQGDDSFTCTNAALAEAAGQVDARAKLDESAVSTGISVFRELGFLQTQGHSVSRSIRMVEGPDHMDLSESVRYREGCEEIEEFDSFKTWALSASADDLLSRFNRPILPSSSDFSA